jgi:hypothetical protein
MNQMVREVKVMRTKQNNERKQLDKAYRDWLLAFDDLRLTFEDLTFHSWSPEKPLVSGRAG